MPEDDLGTTTVADDVDLLTEGEEPSKESDKDSEDLKVSEPEPEPEEDEEEEAEEPKEDIPKFAYYERPSVKQIKEKYPDFFKTFPQMRDMYFRESEYSKIYPTVDDAKEASENSENYVHIRDSVLNGDTKALLNAVKQTDDKSFNKMSGSLLKTLYEISPDAHWQAILPVLQSTVQAFYREGINNNSEDTKNAALYLSRFLFNDLDIATGRKSAIREEPKSQELDEIKRERDGLNAEKLGNFSASVYSEGQDGLMRMIGSERKIDPDGTLSKGMKEYIISKVFSEVDKAIQADSEHMKFVNGLWQKAGRDGYKGDWKSRIVSAYLARARSLVPSIRAKYVSEALGSSAKSSDKASTKVNGQQSRVEPGSGGRASKERSRTYSAKEVDWNKTSDDDFLNDNVTLRKG